MPGIPISGPDSTSFWISFNAGLYSGLIYSVVTGLIVGLVILFVQRITEGWKIRSQYERELSVLCERLRYTIQQGNSFKFNTASESAPNQIVEAINLLSSSPIDLWWENIRSQRDLLELFKDLRRGYLNFLAKAHDLDDKLLYSISKYNFSKESTRMKSDRVPASFTLGKILGVQQEDILALMKVPMELLSWIEPGYQAAIQDIDISTRIEAFIQARNSLIAKFELLRNKLM